MDELIDDLLAVVERRAPDGAGWLRDRSVFDRATFPAAFAAAGRTLGRIPIGDDAGAIRIPWATTSGVDECGRAALVLAAVRALPDPEHVRFVHDLIRRGEVRERQAVLRVLAGLPEPARFVDVAIDAFRTNVQSVFEALACDNAFPADYLPDHAFGQLVLKCLFVGAPLARVHGLPGRITDELARMVEAYASERRAAGRSVPDDVDLVSGSPSLGRRARAPRSRSPSSRRPLTSFIYSVRSRGLVPRTSLSRAAGGRLARLVRRPP